MRGGGNSEPLISKGYESRKSGLRKKFFAFTLAEVLITLGIIGVVAALTIPTLISNHQKKVYVTQLKKAVNTLTNGFKLMLADTGVDHLGDTNLFITGGTPPNTYFVFNEAELKNLKNYFNIVHLEIMSQSIVSSTYHFISGNSVPAHQLSPSSFFNHCNMTTVDGAQIHLLASGQESIKALIDVNGYHRLPNTVGKDVFWVSFDSNGMIVVDSTKYSNSTAPNSSCISSSAAACFDSIVMNNWEITYY